MRRTYQGRRNAANVPRKAKCGERTKEGEGGERTKEGEGGERTKEGATNVPG
jgi:hypothetical protein